MLARLAPVLSSENPNGKARMTNLADGEPTGAGLLIVGAILVALVALFVGVVVLVAWKITRAIRRRRGPDAKPPASPASG